MLKTMYIFCFLGLNCLIWPCSLIADDSQQLHIGKFSQGLLDGWKEKTFAGHTSYNIIKDNNISPVRQVLKAQSKHTASGLFFKQRIDLEQTPWIHWSWKVEHLFQTLDEHSKEGDDFVARLYIVVDGGLFFWDTRALNYVWSSSAAIGEFWPNPFTSNAIMLAVESGNEYQGVWRSYRRNVREDLKNFIGKDVRYIDAVAVMTDSDNAKQHATSYYGDIYFTELE